MIWRSLCLVAAIACAAPAAAQQSDDDASPQASARKIVVGVRSEVKPFSHYNSIKSENNRSTKSGPLRAAGYEGYMIYICDEVFKEMSIRQDSSPDFDVAQVEVVEIEPGQDRFSMLGNGIDILCDPATITRDRVKRFAVSPPLFATGISFLSLPDEVPPPPEALGPGAEKTLIGVVGNTTALDYGVDKIVDSGEWTRYKSHVTKALRATDQEDRENDKDPRKGVIQAFKSHTELSRAFCDGQIVYYVGDLEIISYHSDDHAGCDWQRAPHSYTSDRYGVFAHINYDDTEKTKLIGRFFEVLNREIATSDSLLDRAYFATFRDKPKSRALELFYWSIRGVP